jgi:hypothetical protein
MLEVGGYKISDELFTRGMKNGQGPCQCTAACCEGGVYADVRERDRIMAHQQMIRKYMDDTQPQNAGMWFEKEEHDDPDFPSGRCVGTKEFNDKCAFLDKSGRCILQVAANGEGMSKWFLKPLYCVLYPIEITDRTVCYDNLLEGDERCCSISEDFETPLFQVCREELTHLLGSGGYEMMGDHYRQLVNGDSDRHDGGSTRQ